MSKMLDATCSAAGVVSAEGVTVPAAQVLSEGTKASSGALLLDGEKAKYITSNASDIKDLIERLVTITEKVIEIATGLDAVTTTPGSQAANITLLTTLKTQLNSSKGSIK